MRVAIVHYWWLSNRGGEAVISALVKLYPTADLYLHVCDRELVMRTLGQDFKGRIFTTFIDRLPFSRRFYQKYLALMPFALERLDMTQYDLVISSESGPAKGIITRADALHVCYCHSPMRYLWDMHHEYLDKAGSVVRFIFPWVAHWLRIWDRVSADRVDFFIANSSFISSRIHKYYRRKSKVIWPPVAVKDFSFSEPRGDFYLCLGQMVPYKRFDLAIKAFSDLGLPLVVIGEGEMYKEISSMAAPNIQFLGRQPFSVVKDHLERCKALIFPGLEDFGIVPVEAMAAGAPVVAYGKGGVLDSVIDGVTGILFDAQTVGEIKNAVYKLESGEVVFKPEALHAHALQFSGDAFEKEMQMTIQNLLEGNYTTPRRHPK